MDFQLDCCAPLERELLRVVRGEIGAATHPSGKAELGIAERIHHARASCKRARAALLLMRDVRPHFYVKENAWLRDSARRLARFRDVDVMLACIAEFLARTRARQTGRTFLIAIRAQLRAGQRAERSSHASLQRELTGFGRRMRQAHVRLGRAKLKRIDSDDVVDGFAATYRRARRAMAASVNDAAAQFHRWRKWTKSCAYQCRLLRDAWPPVMKALWHEYSKLGDRLGAEHDLTLLHDYLKHADLPSCSPVSAAAGLRLVDQRRSHHRRRALVLGRRLFADKPRVMARRLRKWWPKRRTGL